MYDHVTGNDAKNQDLEDFKAKVKQQEAYKDYEFIDIWECHFYNFVVHQKSYKQFLNNAGDLRTINELGRLSLSSSVDGAANQAIFMSWDQDHDKDHKCIGLDINACYSSVCIM